jgi:hypothetical protein
MPFLLESCLSGNVGRRQQSLHGAGAGPGMVPGRCPVIGIHNASPGVDQEIDVLRRARAAVRDHGESANQDVPDVVGVQRAGEADEVVELWLT